MILKIMVYLFLQKHPFNVGDLVFKDGTRTLYEVDTNYFNRELQPITVVRPYPIGTQLFGISHHDIKEFKEFRKITSLAVNTTPSDVGITSHDNSNFGKGKKK